LDELRELYQQLILDHNKSPRNFHTMDDPCLSTEGYNPLCGDKLTLYVKIEDDVVADISFVGSGCAISKASASIMTEEIKGKPVDEAKVIFENFREMITTGKVNKEELGKLEVLSGVYKFPSRVKCAILSWHTLKNILDDESGSVASTE
jgi:nitrogen fixation protein NifU and related proteins